jgi:Tfp pilus assembly major pilin PilA
MSQEPRKATDIILELESKINTLLSICRNQDLNIKLLSNKLNSLMEKINKLDKGASTSNKIVVEAVNTVTHPSVPNEKNIPISSENKILLEEQPLGFRRTSRPETFAGDDKYLNKNNASNQVVFPMQLPSMKDTPAEIIVPDQPKEAAKKENKVIAAADSSVPVVQRVVDKNGKGIFLADVEIVNAESLETVSKTRTNGSGKWMASLPLGNYKVTVKKRESLSKEKAEVNQNVQIDGTRSNVELPVMILKI